MQQPREHQHQHQYHNRSRCQPQLRRAFKQVFFGDDGTPHATAAKLPQHVVTSDQTLTADQLHDLLNGHSLLIYRPLKKADWPVKAKPKTAKPAPRKTGRPRKQERPVRYEDGMPVYDDRPPEEVQAELDELFRQWNDCREAPDDAVVVDSDDVLAGLPDQSVTLLHVNGYCLTADAVAHVMRVVKPGGTIKFAPQNDTNN